MSSGARLVLLVAGTPLLSVKLGGLRRCALVEWQTRAVSSADVTVTL